MSDVDNPYANPVSTAAPLSPAEEKQWSVLTHVLSIFFGVVAAGAFFFLFRDRGPFVRHHVTTEWNFQLTVTAISVVGFVVSFLSVFLSMGFEGGGGAPPTIAFFFVGYFLVLAVRLIAVVLGIRAAMVANRGNLYTYPAIRFVQQ
jgi:uncharacterized Tic20 family protein